MRHERHPEGRKNLLNALSLAFAIGVIVLIIGAGATTESVLQTNHITQGFYANWLLWVGLGICASAGFTSYMVTKEDYIRKRGKRG